MIYITLSIIAVLFFISYKGRGEVLITASWMHKSSLPHESNFGQVKRILTRNRKQEKGQQELIGLVEDFAYDDKSEYDERLMSDEEFEEESAEIEAEETVCICVTIHILTCNIPPPPAV